MASLTTNLELIVLAQFESSAFGEAHWGDVANENFSILESAVSDQTSLTITTANVTLTDAQNRTLYLDCSGALTGNRQVIVWAQKSFWFIKNGCSGAFTLTIKTASGTGVVVPQGGAMVVYCDGTNVVPVSTYDASLDDLANMTIAAGDLLYGAGADNWSQLAIGTVGKTLISTGSAPSWGDRVGKVIETVYSTPGTYTAGVNGWTKDDDLMYLEVILVGGGGGGGGVDGQGAGTVGNGIAGGGGGYVKKFYTAADLTNATETFVVGAAGTAGAAGNNAGGNGGDSTFKGLTAGGGAGGNGRTASGASTFVAGADGGTASGGDINIPGSPSTFARYLSGNAYAVSIAGQSAMSNPTRTPVGDSAGNAGTGYGGGGSGAYVADVATNYAGGAGSGGVVIFREYHKQ